MGLFRKARKAVVTETVPIYRFLGTQQPSAGAMRFAFISKQTLPASNAFGLGRQMGWPVVPLLLFSPQVTQLHGVTTQGYGGVIAGQIFTQGLVQN